MTQQVYQEKDLPMEELEKIGVVKSGRLLLPDNALQALLAGRRTDMLRLKDLAMDGFHIAQLDAKLSLKTGPEGKLQLLLHPIYREAAYPEFLTDAEAEALQKGQVVNVWKMVRDEKGKPKDMLVEFDPDTREFVITDTERILVPDQVNNEPLSAEQKEKYRKGKTVQLPDGTRFQFSGTDSQGVRSNRLALIASLIVDGGVSYLLYKGLQAAFGHDPDERRRATMSPGYRQALENMQQQQQQQQKGFAADLPDPDAKMDLRSGRTR